MTTAENVVITIAVSVGVTMSLSDDDSVRRAAHFFAWAWLCLSLLFAAYG